MTEGKTGQRLKVLAALVVFMFAALTTRLWFLQVLASDQYRRDAERNGVRVVPEPAPRGRVLDRRGNLLVKNRLSLVVSVNPQQVGDDRVEQVLLDLSRVLGEPVTVLLERYRDPRYLPFAPIPVAFDVPEEAAFRILEHLDDFPGVTVEKQAVREYPAGQLAVHLLGYTGEVSAEELEQPAFGGYGPGDEVGKSGVERRYEEDLRGVEGTHKYLVNSSGRNLGEIGVGTPPVPGNDIVLSIDLEVQELVEESLSLGIRAARSRGFPSTAGAALVMDPRNGQVVAMASFPDYDPEIFLGRLTQRQLDQLNQPSRHNPLLNRVIGAEYPPASTFKPFIALAAMTDGIKIQGRVVSPSGHYPCPAVYYVPVDEQRTPFGNWKQQDSGYISLERALVESCDTTFYPMGYGYWRVYNSDQEPPPEPLQHHLREFGFGSPTLVDLPYERGGRIPDAAWKRAVHDANPKAYPVGIWYPGDFVNMSIGQGDVVVTPIQMAVAFSAIANGGTVYQPRVALRVQDPDGTVVRRIRSQRAARLPMSQAHLAFIRKALRGVVQSENGTAWFPFRDFPFSRVSVGGKTGTSPNPNRFKEDTAWFAAMAPLDDPQYVVIVVVEEGDHGSVSAAPIARRILEGLFDLPLSTLYVGNATD
ncbi:MAG: penicillin-binding protein 2 [Actinobacteria bacterium]|nr:penicillin-binding protein 2 [Actinomycetota bacterium]